MAEKKIDAGEIQIEDPLDFLSPSEKKAYIRAHQDTLLRSEEEMERIREATEAPPPGITTDTDFEVEDLSGEEDDYEDEYEEEEQPVKKAYVYQDTRLHTDERRSRAVKAAKPAKAEKPVKPARQRVAYAAETAAVLEDDEVEETALDYMLSVAVKAFLAAILIVVLIIAYMIYVRPIIRRATGLSRQAVETQDSGEDTIGMDDTNASAQGGGQAVPADGESVVTTTQLNLRTAPSTETGEVITQVPTGTKLTRLSDDGEWSKVLFDGQELFCASQYLETE